MGGFSEGGWQFKILGCVTRWNSQFLIHTPTFLAILFVASQFLFVCLGQVCGLE
jgi:hypothetical protein